MLYRMLERVNEDREKKIRDKNLALMRKIRRLERRRQGLERGEGGVTDEDDDYEDERCFLRFG